ncbi:anthranilate synthase component II [Planococcus halotolerans]|uniref:Aminodeoxychorismate/anthranilate synthase component II n=1 Tax=Planococcus halotolerans TaxID=2233542 RepID=A0A365L736_9BACL|nr:aminodeoxychorismate/anthranilate synthase component II [Planococcus halotolerans]RAZ81218.1 aminodeoxychorismate/anthranilate synthase component II [Planococcus halotolerans]
MILIIDNYDSFTYNLVHYFEQLDPEVLVFQNTEITAEEIDRMAPDLIVLSPGPGRPAKEGASRDVLEKLSSKMPILGVCLGHQAIVEYFGGTVIKGCQPVHGKVFGMTHDRRGLFAGINSPTQVTRYHSLEAQAASMPECLEITARTNDDAVMAVRHRELPITGIQFHPESILTLDGFQMLKNACEQAKTWKAATRGDAADEETLSSF